MKYIVDEEVIKEKLEHMKLAGFLLGDHRAFADFIMESKQPVELLAEGEVLNLNCHECEEGYCIGYQNMSDILVNHVGLNIKIYTEVVK